MNNSIMMVVLLAPTLAQAAASSSTTTTKKHLNSMQRMQAAATEQDRKAILKEFVHNRDEYLHAESLAEREEELLSSASAQEPEEKKRPHKSDSKEEKAVVDIDQPALQAPPIIKSCVPPLFALAADLLQKQTATQEILNSAGDALAAVWANARPEDSFTSLLDRSYAVVKPLGALYYLADKLEAVPSPIGYPLSLRRPFLENTDIADRICRVPLFGATGTCLPRNPDAKYSQGRPNNRLDLNEKNLVFNEYGGYLAADIKNCLYVVNCKKGTRVAIPHEPARSIDIVFSHDGTAIAIVRHHEHPNLDHGPTYQLSLYASDSGKILHNATNIEHNVSAATIAPFFMYTDADSNVVTYNFATNTESKTPLLQPEEKLIRGSFKPTCPAVKLSPQGTYALFLLERPERKNILCIQHIKSHERCYLSTEFFNAFSIDLRSWPYSLRFNSTESILALSCRENSRIQLFKLKNVTAGETLSTPYAEIDVKYGNGDGFLLNQAGTKLLVASRMPDNDAIVYDITKETIERLESYSNVVRPIYGPCHKLFESHDIVALLEPPEYCYVDSCTLCLPGAQQLLKVGHFLHHSGNGKFVYSKPLSTPYAPALIMRDVTKNIACILTKDSSGSYDSPVHSYFADRKENVFCLRAHLSEIHKLIIDPTNCTLDQLFFLLGIFHATKTCANKIASYNQLLSSPILATFAEEARNHVRAHLRKELRRERATSFKAIRTSLWRGILNGKRTSVKKSTI